MLIPNRYDLSELVDLVHGRGDHMMPAEDMLESWLGASRHWPDHETATAPNVAHLLHRMPEAEALEAARLLADLGQATRQQPGLREADVHMTLEQLRAWASAERPAPWAVELLAALPASTGEAW